MVKESNFIKKVKYSKNLGFLMILFILMQELFKMIKIFIKDNVFKVNFTVKEYYVLTMELNLMEIGNSAQ
jgi:hypothetical protein